jgi:hypothetical protein
MSLRRAVWLFGGVVFVLLFLISLVILITLPPIEAGQRRPTTLQDKLWDEYMLAGNYGFYVMEKRIATVANSPYTWESIDGSAGVAAATKYGIIVHSRRNWWFLFATTGRGWSLEGGLIGLVAVDRGALELQAKSFAYDGPEFVPLGLLSLHGYRASKPVYYELFLLHRNDAPALGAIVKKWVIPVEWEPAFVTPQGKLKYEARSMQAIVDVTGPTRAATFSERIDVSTLVRAAAAK